MLFNSFEFILLFLPITLFGCFALKRFVGTRGAMVWLGIMAVVFYGAWNPRDIVVLAVSVGVNFTFANLLAISPRSRDRWVLAAAMAFNLGLLGYFKYWNFLIENVNAITGAGVGHADIVLPLAISFFTFTQVAILIDLWRDKGTRYTFLEYANFVLFFPHLIAGPIIYHKDTIPQFWKPAAFSPRVRQLTAGTAIFLIGLAKKVVIADTVAQFASPVFDAALNGQSPDFFMAWQGTLAYTFQLYFDFSGYSDMAIGLAFMLGIRLPVNFFSPYKAANIIDFWRRWHISLSRFIRDYVYIPLGGNRRGPGRQTLNVMATMLLVGLWHGAGWTFVVWGGVHGVMISANHVWRKVHAKLAFLPHGTAATRAAARITTFLCVIWAWVLFRAESFDAAISIYRGMLGSFGAKLPEAIANALPLPASLLAKTGVTVHAGGGLDFALAWGSIAILLVVVNFVPNTIELFRHYRPALMQAMQGGPTEIASARQLGRVARWQAFAPSAGWALAACTLTIACFAVLIGGFGSGEFIYFQF